jgi:PKD repeat protein
MKKYHLLAFLSPLIIVVTSCEKPSANFEVEKPDSYCTSFCELSFLNLSNAGEDFLWDFGDGSTSSYENPTHTFQDPGIYTVTLTVFGKSSDESSLSKEVVINTRPEKAIITGITLNRLPLVDFQGNYWDSLNQGLWPDVFVEFNNGSSVIYFSNEANFIENVDSTKLPIHWDFATPYEVSKLSFNRTYYLDIEDKNDNINQVIGYKTFKISDHISGSNYPFKFTINSDELEAEFELDWE